MVDKSKISEVVEDNAGAESAVAVALANLVSGDVPGQMVETPDGRMFIIRRNDFVLDNITPPNKAQVFPPQTIVAAPKAQNAVSFIEYMRRFQNEHSMVFADIQNNRFVGVIDYHTQASAEAKAGSHVLTLDLPKSEEWARWTGQNDKLMSHIDFASFLEENAFDVVKPAGADLLELCRDLQVRQDMNFSSSVRMGDAVSVTYSKDEDATTKSNLQLPINFTIEIPVYFDESNVEMMCWTRRKISDGRLHLGYKINRLEQIRQKEFAHVANEIEAATGVTLIYGTK